MERKCSSLNIKKFTRPNYDINKNPAVSALQDLLFYQIIGIGFFSKHILRYKKIDNDINQKIIRLLYLTNKIVNFSIPVMIAAIDEAYILRIKQENIYKLLLKTNNQKIKKTPTFTQIQPGKTLSQMVSQANIINIQKSISKNNLKEHSFKEIIRLIISASVNYLEYIKNEENIPQTIYTNLFDILNFLGEENSSILNSKNYTLKSGELYNQVLEFIITCYEKNYGLIEKVKITTSIKKGNAILVAGEDFKFLEQLLEETKDKDINIYTYGILNYSHVFPKINRYKHLIGIYNGKYNNLSLDIEHFPGVVLLTSGNFPELREIYRGRIFSTEDISILGVNKINKNDIKPLIIAAYDAPGFAESKENCYVEIGFGIKELSDTANKIYIGLQNKNISNVTILLGCNELSFIKKGSIKSFNKTVIILLGGSISDIDLKGKGFPAVYNLGEFINIYNLIRLLYAISGKFKKDITELPINIILSIKNQENLALLFLLLSLGIKNINITSELPNYITECIISNFSKSYNIQKILDENIFEILKEA